MANKIRPSYQEMVDRYNAVITVYKRLKKVADDLYFEGGVKFMINENSLPKLPDNAVITVIGRRWFERVNGNTYHSVAVYVNGDLVEYMPFDYGYGSMYMQNAGDILAKHYDLPLKRYEHGGMEGLWRLKDKGFKIIDSVTDVERKKDL